MESIYEYVLAELQASRGKWRRIAADTEMSVRTIEKIASQEIADPGVSHIEKLANYFRAAKPTRSRPAQARVAT